MGKLVANVDDDVKARAAALYDSMGMSLSTAVNMFLRQSLVDNGLRSGRRDTRRTVIRCRLFTMHTCSSVRRRAM